MKVLVSGGTGFAGSNLVRELLDEDAEVICLDLRPPDVLAMEYLGPRLADVQFVTADIAGDWRRTIREVTGVTHIIHAAAFTGLLPHVERDRGADIIRTNVMGTVGMLELASRLNVQRLMYVSSNSVYGGGSPDSVFTEEDAVRPISLYAISKYAGEMIAARYGRAHEFGVVIARFGSLYGPMEKPGPHRENQSLIREWTEEAVAGRSIRVRGYESVHSLSYVGDVARWAIALLRTEKLSYSTYNVDAGAAVTVADIADAFRDASQAISVVSDPDAPDWGATTLVSSDRLQEAIGPVRGLDLATGITRYLEWRRAAVGYEMSDGGS